MFTEEHSNLGKAAAGGLDALLVVGSYYAAHFGYDRLVYRSRYAGEAPPAFEHVWLVAVFIPALVLLFNHYELLTFDRARPVRTMILQLVRSFVLVGIVLSGTIFLTKAKDYPRPLLAMHWALSFAAVGGEKLLLHWLNRAHMLELAPARVVALVGEGPKAGRVAEHLRRDPGFELPANGRFDLTVSVDDFQQYLVCHHTDEVYFVIPRTASEFRIDPYLTLCERLGIPAKVALNLQEAFRYFTPSFGGSDDLPLVVFHPPYLNPDRAVVKRLMDVCGACVGLLITALITPVVAVAIRLDSEGPVFFTQERVGQNGRRFRMYKFRTMIAGADRQKAALQDYNEMDGPMFKIKDDPRITRVGRVLRRLSIDEFPQFWNVLKGDMSLVGTRPPTPEEVEQYELWHYRRISIRPGITGMWQVSGRYDVNDFHEIVRLDLQYIDDWSLWLDIRILARTFIAFASGR
jgi:exopolysaccharide biosynthesis polyprenyl glycosylphosphotransferase